MGLSASQARFLQLTARRSDIEYEVQQINFQRLQLSEKLSMASNEYQDKMNNRKLLFSFNTGSEVQKVDLSYSNYKNYMNQQLSESISQDKYYLVSSSGNKLVVSSREEMEEIMEKNISRIPLKDVETAQNIYNSQEDKTKLGERLLAMANLDTSDLTIDENGDYTISAQSINNVMAEYNAQTDKSKLDNTTIALAQIYSTLFKPDESGNYSDEKISSEEMKIIKSLYKNKDNGAALVSKLQNLMQYSSGSYAKETAGNSEYYLDYKYDESDFIIDENLNDVTAFQNAIKNGTYYFAKYEEDSESHEMVLKTQGWDTLGGGAIVEEYDKSDDAQAQAEYDSIQSKVQTMDKKLELKLDQLETNRQAIQTEIESVQKVIEDNVEKSFNIFS